MNSPTHTPAARSSGRWRFALVAAILAAVVGAVSWTTVGPWRLTAGEQTPISQGRPATASSTEGKHWSPAAAVDGNRDTRWSSAFSDPQWLQVDLGRLVDVEQVGLHWQRAYAAAFEIQLSTDAVNWSSAYRTTAGTGCHQRLDLSGQGRYVRMSGLRRATSYGYSLWEFQVFGQPAADGPPSPSANAGHAHSPPPPPSSPPHRHTRRAGSAATATTTSTSPRTVRPVAG